VSERVALGRAAPPEVCVVAIDSSETRHIDDMGVYSITATFSVFAYVWLLLIVVIVTPDRVDLWEAVLTFLFFPIMVEP